METKELMIGDVTYTYRPGNFMESKKQAMALAGLLKGAIGTKDKGNGVSTFDIDIGTLAANLGSSEMQGIENFVLKYLEADTGGKKVLLRDPDKVNSHFNAYREHYFRVIFEGIKYHFFPFLPDGGEFLRSMDLSKLTDTLTSQPKQTG